ncbi:MAG TPA: hypothetical protein VF186_10305 [Gaiellaceae bacterium]|jgi:hypothetical protein
MTNTVGSDAGSSTRRGVELTVLNPVGYAPKVTAKSMAPRLNSLEGKTLCLLDCRFDNSDVFLRQLQDWLAEHQPGVRTHVVQMKESWVDDPEALEEVSRYGDAAIAGVGL